MTKHRSPLATHSHRMATRHSRVTSLHCLDHSKGSMHSLCNMPAISVLAINMHNLDRLVVISMVAVSNRHGASSSRVISRIRSQLSRAVGTF